MTQQSGVKGALAQAGEAASGPRRPPRVPLAFRVGIVGHRPNRLKHADERVLAGVMADVLRAVREAVETVRASTDSPYAADPPVLRAVSPLAEGSDRIFAEAALGQSFELCCIMPFAQEEYEKDFGAGAALEPGSLERFRTLLAQAATRFELDGRRGDEGAAYGGGGRLVLRQSDLLVVVWDGERQGKAGGTEQTFDEARALGVPVVWIDAHAPHAWQVVNAKSPLPPASSGVRAVPRAGDTPERIKDVVRCTLAAPDDAEACGRPRSERAGTGASGVSLRDYFAERRPNRSYSQFWRLAGGIMGDGLSKARDTWRKAVKEFGVPDFEEAVTREWPKDRRTPVACFIDDLRRYYAWPDKVSGLYADAYRTMFSGAYLLAALAVALALLPVATGWIIEVDHFGATVCVLAEVGTILALLWYVHRGKSRGWHERWIEYRLAAEMIRHLRMVGPLGGERPFPPPPGHLADYGHPAATWMAWYVRTVERYVGLPSARVGQAYLEEVLADLRGVLDGQRSYHQNTARRCYTIENRLHWLGAALLALTVVAGCVHLVPQLWPAMHKYHGVALTMTFLCGFLPALGAALVGINNQAEFRRVARRSAAMVSQFEELLRVARAQSDTLADPVAASTVTRAQVAALAGKAAQLMVNEVLDWRVVFLDRPPEMRG